MEVGADTRLEELRSMLEPLMPAFDIMPDPIRVADLEGRVIYVNKPFLHLTGHSPTEIMHRSITDAYVDEDQYRVHTAFASLVKTGQWIGTLEVRMRRKGGEPMMVSLNCVALKNSKQEVIGAFAVFRDVSRLERILAEPIELLNLTGSPVEVLRQLPARVATYFPGRPWVMINLVEGDYLRFAYAVNVPSELMAQGGEPLKGSICSIPIITGKFLGIGDMTEDDRTRQDLCVTQYGCRGYLGYPIIHTSGKILGTICILRTNRGGFGEYDQRGIQMFAKRTAMEIERVELETKLQESEKELWDTVEYAPVLLWRVQPDGRILMISKKGREDLGYGEHEQIRESWFDLVHPEDLPELKYKIGTLSNKNGHGVFTTPIRFRKRSGNYGNFFTTVRPVYDGLGRMKLLEGVAFEIPQDS